MRTEATLNEMRRALRAIFRRASLEENGVRCCEQLKTFIKIRFELETYSRIVSNVSYCVLLYYLVIFLPLGITVVLSRTRSLCLLSSLSLPFKPISIMAEETS